MELPVHVEPTIPLHSGPDLSERLGALLEVLIVSLAGYLIVPIVFSLLGISADQILTSTRYLFIVMTSEATITLILIWCFLWFRGKGGKEIGWGAEAPGKELSIGILIVPLLFLSTFVFGLLFQIFLPQYVTEENPLLELIETRWDLMLWVISSIYVGGLKEEVQRAFILVRFEKYLGGIWLGLAIWTAFFAYGHSVQGVDKAAGAGLLGLIFGLVFIRRRCLIAPGVSHALYDIITLTAFWFLLRT
jgi:membrane protease YdiL (CAAX protease family)